MPAKSTPPSISETAFDCPNCGVFTTQNWFSLYPKSFDEKTRTPPIPDAEMAERTRTNKEMDAEWKAKSIDWIEKMNSGFIFLAENKQTHYHFKEANNLFLSQCYNCKKFAVWVHDQLIYPTAMTGPEPNPDLPPDILRDYEEAGRIMSESSRGAAALLRLGIQKLCISLGEKGQNIDDDIASLVKKGLAPIVQKALDVVRVIGNEAVY